MPWFFEFCLFCILRHLNDNKAYPPTKARFLDDWGLHGMNVPFSICHLPTEDCISHRSLFEHSRCFRSDTKGADGAADLLEVLRNSSVQKLNFEDCDQIPSTAWQKLRGASWTNLREANFRGRLVLQIWLRCLASSLRRGVFFPNVNLRAIVTAVSLTTFDNIERPKMWNRQVQMVGLSKVTCKSSGNRWQSFYRLPREDGIPVSSANMAYCHLQ